MLNKVYSARKWSVLFLPQSQKAVISNVDKRLYFRVWLKLLSISPPKADIQVIKLELCCHIWLHFAMVTVHSRAVGLEMYQDSVIALLHNANFKAASHCCLYQAPTPKHKPFKSLHQARWWKYWALKIVQATFQFLDLENRTGGSGDPRKKKYSVNSWSHVTRTI